MQDQVELAATIQSAMRELKLSPEALAKKLGVNGIMVNKLICGEVVPSTHLEQQMIEVLRIDPKRVSNLSGRRQKSAGSRPQHILRAGFRKHRHFVLNEYWLTMVF